MSNPYDSQYTDDDFMDIWWPDRTDTISLDDDDSTEMNPETLDFLTATDPFNPGAAIPHKHDLDIDLSLDWRVPGPSSNQLSNTRIPDNTVFPLQKSNQPFVSFGQRLPKHNLQDFYFDHLKHSLHGCPSSTYPSPDLDNGTGTPSYSRQILQQPRQFLHSTALDLCSNNINFELNPNRQFASNYNTRETQNGSPERSRASLGGQKVSFSRTAKQEGDPSCDPSLCYTLDPNKVISWGSLTWNGQHLFSYTTKGQWLRDRCFTKQQFREYADNCGKDTVFWVQQAPTQCNHRLEPEDRICRWANCPVANRTITAGWLRVAFDEFPHLTSNGARDPLKCAGSVHLWCFEQIFDPMEFHLSGRLRAEDRQFPFEDKSVVTLEKLTDAGIIREAYRPWFEQRMFNFNQQPREYRDSLSYRLTKYHIENQTAARQRARSKRNDTKSESERRTIDVHLGDLKMFVEITNRVRRSKKIRKLRRAKAEDDDDLSDSSSQPWVLTSTRPKRNRGSFLADKNMREAPGRGMGPAYGKYIQSDLARFYSVSSQNRDSNIYQFSPILNSNMSNRQPSYFDPLSPAPYSMQSTIRSSVATASTLPNYFQNSHLDVSSQNYSQNVAGERFNRATKGQHRPVLRPLITQHMQQCPFSVKPSTRRDAFTQTTRETLPLLGGSSNTGLFDSYRGRNPAVEELDSDFPVDPRISEDELRMS